MRTFKDTMREMTALLACLNVAHQVLKIFFFPEDTQLGFDKNKLRVFVQFNLFSYEEHICTGFIG